MPTDGMLGRLPLSAVRGPKDALDTLLASAEGELILREFHRFVRKQPCWIVAPTMFELNQHGHILLNVTGINLEGRQEIERLKAASYEVTRLAEECLLSAHGYDEKHRLADGKTYRIAIMPGYLIDRKADRTTVELQKRAAKYGYDKPLAGIMPRIRESVSQKKMLEEMGFSYIAALHDPVPSLSNNSGVLVSKMVLRARSLTLIDVGAFHGWEDRGGFAFFDSTD